MIDMPFEKLLVWKKAIDLANFIYDLTEHLPKEEIFGLKSQMRRAVVSISANISEGSQRTSQKEFGHFILMAKGSLAELRTEAYIARNRNFLSNDDWNAFVPKAQELDKMLRAFYISLTKKKP